jgi:hypothetical protein
MDYINDIVDSELEKLSSEERAIFREVVLSTFRLLHADIVNRMNNFESKILDTTILKSKNISIVNMIVPKDDMYLYEENFTSMLSADMMEMPFIDILLSEEKIYKKVVFLGTNLEAEEIKNMNLNGSMLVNCKKFDFILKIEKDERYNAQVKLLYKIFGLNHLKWHTINAPYANRMYKIKIIEFDKNIITEINSLKIDEAIPQIKIENNIYYRYFIDNYIPIWNITEIALYGNGLIEPTYQMIHYEHTVNFEDINDIYLRPIDGINVYSLEHITGGFRIETDTNKDINWEFISIPDVRNIRFEGKLKYPVFSNAVDMEFINKLRLQNDSRIRTLGEIQRLVKSYKNVAERFELERVEITMGELDCVETRDLNYFMIDEFKLKEQTKKMYLFFNVLNNDAYIGDQLDFIISVLQVYFPEYLCIGVIL